MSKNINIPKLRFKEFSGEWEEKTLEELTKINQGLQIPISKRYIEQVEDSYFYITNEFLKKGSKNKYFIKNPSLSVICNKDDVLMTRTGNTGQVVTDIEGAFHNNFFKIKYSNELTKDFLIYFLRLRTTQNMILRYAGTSTIPDLNHGDFYRLKINLPSKQEQEKIASFLTSVDTKIEQLTKKETLLKEYKKGVMQKIFNQEIRFVSDDGSEFCEWEEKNFGEVFKRITTKNKENNLNVLTISAQQGLINQEKYFNKSVSAKDVTGYYLLENGDFAYNKSYSKGYPMGAIKKLNNYDKGVVSTLYICFRIKDDNDSVFYEKYFDSGFLNKELHKIAQEGARNHGLLNMSVVEFFSDIKIPVPSREEQNKIANFISSIDTKIEQTQKQLEQTKEFKKALLQQMFV